MSNIDSPLSTPHPAVMLLPWYLTDSLAASERHQVDEHLRQCPECRAELDLLAQLNTDMHVSWKSQEPMTPDLRSRVLAQISNRKVASIEEGRDRAWGGKFRFKTRRAGSLFPALAATLIGIQFAAILWMLRTPTPSPGVVTRTVDSGSALIKVIFQPTATEADLRGAVIALGARIVDGPDASAAYTLQLPKERPEVTAKKLAELGRRKALVERIELAAPR